MAFNELELAAPGRAPIVVRLFEPPRSPRATVIIAPAMGVPQSFYGLFAEWLLTRGYVVITFDYRGMGLAAPRSLRGFDVDIVGWARDCEAIVEFAHRRDPHRPLHWIGHSLGGQLLGLIDNRSRLTKVITIATGNGYWRENSWPTKRVVWLLWFCIAPLATAIIGYFPGKPLHIVGNLPRGVIAQWRRWCLDPEYVVGVEGAEVRAKYASFDRPIIAFSFTDDEMMSERSIASLHALYHSAPKEFRRISPQDIGVKRIGHFGLFRADSEATL